MFILYAMGMMLMAYMLVEKISRKWLQQHCYLFYSIAFIFSSLLIESALIHIGWKGAKWRIFDRDWLLAMLCLMALFQLLLDAVVASKSVLGRKNKHDEA